MPPKTASAIGVDVGGTKCLAVAIDDAGEIIKRFSSPTPAGSEAVLDAIAMAARKVGFDDASTPVGVGLPGLITDDGLFVSGPNLPTVVNVDVGRELGTRLSSNVLIDNDATCAAWGEFRHGAGQEFESIVLVALGTGIGGGMIANGDVVRGIRGLTAELGHMVVQRDGWPCACGRLGCIEAYASGAGLATLARRAAENGRLASLGDREPSSITGEMVTAAADAGNPEAKALLVELGRWLGIAVTNLVNAVAPEVVLIGGGLSDAFEHFGDAVREVLAAEGISEIHRQIPIKRAKLGPDAGAIGAAWLAATSCS